MLLADIRDYIEKRFFDNWTASTVAYESVKTKVKEDKFIALDIQPYRVISSLDKKSNQAEIILSVTVYAPTAYEVDVLTDKVLVFVNDMPSVSQSEHYFGFSGSLNANTYYQEVNITMLFSSCIPKAAPLPKGSFSNAFGHSFHK